MTLSDPWGSSASIICDPWLEIPRAAGRMQSSDAKRDALSRLLLSLYLPKALVALECIIREAEWETVAAKR